MILLSPITVPRQPESVAIILDDLHLTGPSVIRHILEHLSLWQAKPTRDAPAPNALPEIVCEQYDDGWPGYEEPCALMN